MTPAALRRPLGITILALLHWGVGLIYLGSGLLMTLLVSEFTGPLTAAVGVPLSGIGALLCFAGYGLWLLRSWAWWVGLIAASLAASGSLVGIVGGEALTEGIIALLINGTILAYLWTRPIRSSFVGRRVEPLEMPPAFGRAVTLGPAYVVLYLALFLAVVALFALLFSLE